MKYKLINSVTKIETICDKVTIDGFDYYVSEDEIKVGDYYLTFTNKTVIGNVRRCEDSSYSFTHCKKVIATNNPDIDIPKVVDEVEILTKLDLIHLIKILKKSEDYKSIMGITLEATLLKILKQSKETHPFSEEDMIEFADWCAIYYSCNQKRKQWYKYADKTDDIKPYTTKELLQLWKEQKPKIVYYEN